MSICKKILFYLMSLDSFLHLPYSQRTVFCCFWMLQSLKRFIVIMYPLYFWILSGLANMIAEKYNCYVNILAKIISIIHSDFLEDIKNSCPSFFNAAAVIFLIFCSKKKLYVISKGCTLLLGPPLHSSKWSETYKKWGVVSFWHF